MSDKPNAELLALLAEQERIGIVDLIRDDEDGSVIGWTTPQVPPPAANRGRGRYPVAPRFRDAMIRFRFAELSREGRYAFKQVPEKPNKAAIYRALASEFKLSEDLIKSIVAAR